MRRMLPVLVLLPLPPLVAELLLPRLLTLPLLPPPDDAPASAR